MVKTMKKIIKYFILATICISSFYITEKVALNVKMKNPIISDINKLKEEKNIDYINCIFIDDTYVIPGLNGREINVDKSFQKMKNQAEFDENLLVYNQIKPSKSIEDNKDKIIIRGNNKKNSISLVFSNEGNLSKYLLQKDYKINILIDEEKYNLKYEMINNSNKEDVYNNIEKYLNKNKVNSNLCMIKSNVSKLCKNKYLFKPSLTINHSNFSSELKKIKSGEIIYIENTLTLDELNLLINQIEYQSLRIIPLSELISEINWL